MIKEKTITKQERAAYLKLQIRSTERLRTEMIDPQLGAFGMSTYRNLNNSELMSFGRMGDEIDVYKMELKKLLTFWEYFKYIITGK